MFFHEVNNIEQYYTLRFYFPYLTLLVQPVNILVYYTLRLYFPNLSLLAQPVNILVYWPGPINIMFSSEFCPNLFFVLDIQ